MVTDKEQKIMKNLHEKGYTIAEIARICKRNKRTVTRYVTGKIGKKSILDPYKSYIQRRMNEGQYSPTIILKEIRDLGYKGKLGTVHLYVKEKKDEIRTEIEPLVDTLKSEDPKNNIKAFSQIQLTHSKSEIIGREREIDELCDIYQRMSNKNGQICLLSGSDGTGKSKIENIFFNRINNIHNEDEPLILKGRCWVHYNRISYGVFIGIIRQFFNLKISLDKKGILNNVNKKFSEIDKTNNPLNLNEKITIKLLIGIELNPREQKEFNKLNFDQRNVFFLENIANFFIRLSKIYHKLIIVIDDAQWMDEKPINLLEKLVSKIHEYPIFIILLARPSIIDTLPSSIKRNPNFHLFLIHPLNQDKTRLLIQQILGVTDIGNRLFQYILEVSSGIPLYIDSLIIILKKLGVLVEIENSVDLQANIEDKLPQKMREVLITQASGLSAELKRICQTASVIGEPFGAKMLLHFVDYKGDLLDKLVELESSKLINKLPEADGELDNFTGEYEFTNKLSKSIFYRRLMRKQKRNYHQKIAKIIEKQQKNNLTEYYPVLAYHYDKSLDKDKAGYFYAKTGEQLEALSDPKTIKYYEHARKFYEDNDEHLYTFLELSAKIAYWHYSTGNLDKALLEYQKLKDIAEIENHALSAAKATSYLSKIYLIRGDFKQAYVTARKARQLSEKADDKDNLGFAGLVLAELESLSGDYDRALDRIQEVKPLLKQSALKIQNCDAGLVEGELYLQKEDYNKAKIYFIQALEKLTEFEYPAGTIRTYYNLMSYASSINDYDYFWEYAKRCLDYINSEKQKESNPEYLIRIILYYSLLANKLETIEKKSVNFKNDFISQLTIGNSKEEIWDYALNQAHTLLNPYPQQLVYEQYGRYLLIKDPENKKGKEYFIESKKLKDRMETEFGFMGLV